MPLFNHKVSFTEILKEIPQEEFIRIAKETRVDHYSKVLSGKLMFELLIYGMLRINKLSQRGLSDAFSSPFFKAIFSIKSDGSISHSSISERLSKIELSFFRQAYECIYQRFSHLYTKKEISGMYLERVDSSLVLESCNKLKEGLIYGNQNYKGKMIKYTFNFDGMFASLGNMYTQKEYASEAYPLSHNILEHYQTVLKYCKKEVEQARVYLFDRGQNSTDAFKELKQKTGLLFVGRMLENRKLKILEEFPLQKESFTHGELMQDALVQIYKKEELTYQNGKPSHHSTLCEETFRVVRFKPQTQEMPILLITNIMGLQANDIAGMYKKRWDIEVFFRFLKQELNFSHFLSLDSNGIQVVMYMTMITAMLVMIYKKENQIGYKTAIRRMMMELEGMIMAITVLQSGGDLSKTNLPKQCYTDIYINT